MLHKYEFWLDCNISPIIAKWLQTELNLTVKSSYILQLAGLSDFEIYTKAQKINNVIIISKDSDLHEIITKNGSPPKLILLRIKNTDNKIVFKFLLSNLEKAVRLLEQFQKDIIEIN